MPANDRLWSNNDKVVSPLRPQPEKGDPERSIERAQSRSGPFLGIDCELLPEGQLDDGLFLTAPEEGAQAGEKSDRELDQRPHGSRTIAWGRTSLNLGFRWVYHPWMDVKGGVEKLSNINADEY